MSKYSLGRTAEKIAANYFLAQDYEILTAHYYNKQGYHIGEIDLIVKDKKNNQLVFVEVKARRIKQGQIENEIPVPENNITFNKIKKIVGVAEYYLRETNQLGKAWRVDGLAISLNFTTRKMKIKHIKNIRI